MTPQQRLLGQSALQAYRSDIVPGSPEPTREDQDAILVATLLRQSLAAADEETATRIQGEAIALARKSLGETILSQGCTYDDHPARSRSDVIRLLAQRTDHAGRLRLAQHLLESAAELETDAIECGRILSDRAKTSRKLGYLDLAFAQYTKLLSDAKALRSGELLAMAHQGLAAFAETRGNFVEYRSHIRSMIRIARAHRLTKLSAAGYAGLGKSQALLGLFGDAVENLWKAYQLSEGNGYIAWMALGNLAQTLLVSGRPAEARKIATMVIHDSPSLVTAAPSIGAYAVTSAQLRDVAGVRWAAAQLARFDGSVGNPREVAEALMECSAALDAIGESTEAATMKRRSDDLAVHYGFHSLTFQEAMVSVQRASEPQRFKASAAKAAAAIREMEVPRLPDLAVALQA